LSEENKKQLFIPKGFAHGFLVLSDEAEFVYKCTDFYNGEDEGGIIWNDPEIAIDWPLEGIGEENILLSYKDKLWKPMKETETDF
ncbi:MAG: dTDP-4-dehydrorhamnose 3,5-epimerase family protein, partial [Methanobrevibacter sp.]|nr:dTDP-4-dehydrorhamnose 3,5-epimerase family protein [Methanobrevibacter sp.]